MIARIRKKFILFLPVIFAFLPDRIVTQSENGSVIMKINDDSINIQPSMKISQHNFVIKEKRRVNNTQKNDKQNSSVDKTEITNFHRLYFPHNLRIVEEVLKNLKNEQCAKDTTQVLDAMTRHERWALESNVAEASNLPPTYGGRHIVTMLPGVGSGPQMMKYVKDVFKVAYVPVDFEVIDYDKMLDGNGGNQTAIESVLSSIRRNCVGIKGHIPDISANLLLRSQLDLYVYFVHCRTYQNIKCRQNTQGEYGMLEHESRPGVVESLKIITKYNTERFAKWAFDFARRKCRNRISVVHKANIMPLSDGLFLETVLGVAKDYPDLKVKDVVVEKCCSQIICDPSDFDVILTPNLYGNIVTSVICGLIGGPGLISGQNYGDHSAVFEVASRHIFFEDERSVNPVAMLNASMNLLYHLKLNNHANLIKDSIVKTLVEDRTQTADIGGSNTGPEVVENIKRNIKEGLKEHNVSIF